MKNNTLALILVVVCLACLVLGLFIKTADEVYSKSSPRTKIGSLIKGNVNKVALINIDGVIDSSNNIKAFSSDFSAQSALKALKTAEKDSEIKGIIIKMNTPGGTVAMSQSIYHEVIRIRKNKPVVVVMEDVAASGGYYIASAADRIYALEGTLTGSIGVIFSTMNLHQLLSEKLLISPNVVKSGKYKDIGSAYRPMTRDDRALLQGIVNDSYSQFITAIKEGRIARNDSYSEQKSVLKYDTLKKYADGRIFTGSQAKKLGFVDSIGDLTDAQDAIGGMISEKFKTGKNVILIPYSKSSSFGDYLFGATENIFNPKACINSLIPVSMQLNKRPLYLWE